MADKKPKNKLTDPALYINRELSWLEFNDRVLEEAHDKTNPLLERCKFLAISASNLDEFFMVRVSSVLDMAEAGLTGADAAGMPPKRQLEAMTARARAMFFRQYQTLTKSIMPELTREGIRVMPYDELDAAWRRAAEEYFEHTLFPILTPMAIDSGRPFPLLSNKSINLIVELATEDELFAVVKVPTVVPRFFEPTADRGRVFVPIEEIIKPHIGRLFEGYGVSSVGCFRLTRDSDLEYDEEDAEDLMDEIERSLRRRQWGRPVRLELEKGMGKASRAFLMTALEVDESAVYEAGGLLDLTALFWLCGLDGYDALRDAPAPPVPVAAFSGDAPVFDVIAKQDVLAHYPYESFDDFQSFIDAAADDADVLAIKQTIYRVGKDSPVLNALARAAENGKQVTVLMELKARFDEENNIAWAKQLERAGCHVVYGLVGLKTHCKLCLVVRGEDDGIRRYCHLGTGNYNAATARVYTDLGLFTARESIGQDVSALFNVLTGYSINLSWNKLSVAPVSLKQTFLKLIENEAACAAQGKPAAIDAKMNALVDPVIIQALYKASMAGVKIRLIVRGICCLRPGVKDVSENISVYSIVGRFLEHSRVYWFENGGEPLTYLSSADWMPRNLDRRVEAAFPIDDETLKARIRRVLDTHLADTVKLRVLKPDGTYVKQDGRGRKALSSQQALYEAARERAKEARAKEDGFRPIVSGAADYDDFDS